MLKKKLENNNAYSRFLLNKIFYVTLILWILLAIFLVIWNLIPCVNKEICNAIIGIFTSFLALVFAYYWGNFDSSKEKRVKRIWEYVDDLKKTRKNLKEIKDEFKAEFIYQYQYIIEFIKSFLEKFEAQELDLIFVERWKISTIVNKNLDTIIENNKLSLKKFKKCIENLKAINADDEKINKIINLLVAINMDRKNLSIILSDTNDELKEIIISLNECLVPFISNEIEALKQNLDLLIIETNKKEKFYMDNIKECRKHKHYLKVKTNWPLCWTTIRKIENYILS